MNRYKKHIPEGVQDYLSEECYNKRVLEERVRQRFILCGYDEIVTPAFEYYDVFASGIGSVRQEKMIKFFDNHGRILVLRPDITMPIARVAATKLKSFPQRLCYIGEAFGCESTQNSSMKEFTQAGIELLGVSGAQADAEVIAIAIETLKTANLKNFQIDIGQVEFFKGLMEEAGITGEQSEELREYVDQKNDLAVELFLKRNGIEGSVRRKIMQLPTLYGSADVFLEAERFSSNPRCRAAVDNLRQVYEILCDFGVADCVSIDFGMLQSIDYYSGIIFRGISGELGYPLLTGGRYDKLIGEFGEDVPATGFAMGIKRILIALERQGSLLHVPAVEFVVSAQKCARAKAYAQIKKLHEEGRRVQSAFHLNREELTRYAQERGAQPLYVEED